MDASLILFGGLLTILGGVVGAVILGRIDNAREEARRKAAHKAAVVAVLMELGANVVVSEKAGPSWWIRGWAWQWSHSVHDQMASSLYSVDLPFSVAWKVGNAYAAMRAVRRPEDSAVEEFRAAFRALLDHASSLGLLKDLDLSKIGVTTDP